VPGVDMVAFMNPRKSRVDIVQAIGRAMPKAGPDKKFGYVVVPLLLDRDPGETIEEALKRTDFEAVADVVNAMREQDGDLVDIIREMRPALARDGAFDTTRLDEKVEVIGPKIELSAIRDAIEAEIVERLGSNWDEMYGRLISYKDENGDCNVPVDYSDKQLAYWVRNRRAKYKKSALDAEYGRRLNAVGFV
jgi:predicted helicase